MLVAEPFEDGADGAFVIGCAQHQTPGDLPGCRNQMGALGERASRMIVAEDRCVVQGLRRLSATDGS